MEMVWHAGTTTSMAITGSHDFAPTWCHWPPKKSLLVLNWAQCLWLSPRARCTGRRGLLACMVHQGPGLLTGATAFLALLVDGLVAFGLLALAAALALLRLGFVWLCLTPT